MGPSRVPTLDELATAPERVNDLAPMVARDLLLRVLGLQTALAVRAVSPSPGSHDGDRLLTVKEAAARLHMSEDWLYRNAATLPFTRRQGRALRFSEAGIARYLRDQGRA